MVAIIKLKCEFGFKNLRIYWTFHTLIFRPRSTCYVDEDSNITTIETTSEVHAYYEFNTGIRVIKGEAVVVSPNTPAFFTGQGSHYKCWV